MSTRLCSLKSVNLKKNDDEQNGKNAKNAQNTDNTFILGAASTRLVTEVSSSLSRALWYSAIASLST